MQLIHAKIAMLQCILYSRQEPITLNLQLPYLAYETALLMDLKGLLYLIVKIRGKIDMTITWSVKTPLDGKKVVARSGLLVPDFVYYILPVWCR